MASRVFILVVALFGVALASQRHFVEGQQRKEIPFGWEHSRAANPTSTVKMMIGLQQRNLDELERRFWAVSDPKNSQYGQFMTIDEITELVAPAEEKLKETVEWLKENNVHIDDIVRNKDAIFVSMPVSVANSLLNIQLQEFYHAKTGASAIRTLEAYSIPSSLASHIQIISGVNEFPVTKKIDSFTSRVAPSAVSQTGGEPIIVGRLSGGGEIFVVVYVTCQNYGNTSDPTAPCSDHPPAVTGFVATLSWPGEQTTTEIDMPVPSTCFAESGGVICLLLLQNSDIRDYEEYGISVATAFGSDTSSANTYPYPIVPGAWVTPETVWQFYKVPANTRSTNPLNSQAVVEFIQQYYSPTDLTDYFELMGQTPQPVAKVVGDNDPTNPGTEATLDIQYIMGVAPDTPTWFWYMDGNAFILEWANAVANTPNPPLVHSISYGGPEASFGKQYSDASNVALIKLGLLGLTVVIASGDNGVMDSDGIACGPFFPDFPSGSPYVLSVGATRTAKQTKPVCYNSVYGAPIRCNEFTGGEIPCELDFGAGFTSGGGFSMFNLRPQYQAAVVETYLENTDILPPSSYFNVTGRAYPDVSALGHNLLIVVSGSLEPVDGTSASAPIFSGLISLLNDARLNLGQQPFGFINTWLYQIAADFPEVFTDVVVGNNRCQESACCEYGFTATVGWDPVAGLGTPNFEVLKRIVEGGAN